MHPILTTLSFGGGSLTIYAYGFFLAAAALLGGALFVRGAVGVGLSRSRAFGLFLTALAGGLVGARVLDTLMNLPYYLANPGQFLSTDLDGFALFGGLAGAILATVLWSRRWGLSLRRLADATIPAVVVGIVLLRVGCFLNGCCAGIPTSLPWGVVFPPATDPEGVLLAGPLSLFGITASAPVPVHPTQIYELLAAAVLGLLAVYIKRRGAVPGLPALCFTSGFLLFRAANQALRPSSLDAVFSTPLLVAIYFAAGLAAGAVLLYAVARERRALALGPATA
jgi:phosphatidylglycerol:prolipoprotein diacylglycerol transferase